MRRGRELRDVNTDAAGLYAHGVRTYAGKRSGSHGFRPLSDGCEASETEKKASTQAKTAGYSNSKPPEIHDLVLKVRKETGWGAGRIKGQLYRLGYKTIGRNRIYRISRENGFKPETGFRSDHREGVPAGIRV